MYWKLGHSYDFFPYGSAKARKTGLRAEFTYLNSKVGLAKSFQIYELLEIQQFCRKINISKLLHSYLIRTGIVFVFSRWMGFTYVGP